MSSRARSTLPPSSCGTISVDVFAVLIVTSRSCFSNTPSSSAAKAGTPLSEAKTASLSGPSADASEPEPSEEQAVHRASAATAVAARARKRVEAMRVQSFCRARQCGRSGKLRPWRA
ncbi:hypothetical protein SHIRM173S_07732 [Streptomyces hirsutus]